MTTTEQQQSIDEANLLGDDLHSDHIFTGDINEDELLGLNENTNDDTTPETKPVARTLSTSQGDEELDYDEDVEEKKEKFTSERKQETTNSQTSSDASQKSGVKLFVNPKFQNRLPHPPPNNGVRSSMPPPPNGPLPSLLGQSIPPPIVSGPMMMPPAVNINAVLMNSLRPMPPANPMMRPMGGPPNFAMPAPGFTAPPPSGHMMPPPPGTMPPPNGPPPAGGPIHAQIGQLPTVIQQQQDGTITFRTTIPPPTQPIRVTNVRAGFNESDQQSSSGKDWDKMVEEFIKAPPKSKKRGRRDRSRSASSRSLSTSSYSDSYSDDSASTYSRSPSPRHRRRHRRSPSRKRPRDYASRRSHHRHHSFRHDRPRRSPRRRRNSKEDELKNTVECAETMGLDQDYLRKLEEQKRMREEVARKKYQKEESARNDESRRSSRRNEPSSTRSRRTDEDRGRPKSDSKSQPQPLSQQQQLSATNSSLEAKLKPYLVVVVHNLTNLSDAYKRMKMTANAVGTTKKVWQTSDDSVSIIFENHEHAKNFMLQYHMKQFNGITLNISLEKVFLNLSSIP